MKNGKMMTMRSFRRLYGAFFGLHNRMGSVERGYFSRSFFAARRMNKL